jgi:hypothetical protein
MIAMRAVQGLGAALVAPVILTILTTTFNEVGDPGRTRFLVLAVQSRSDMSSTKR